MDRQQATAMALAQWLQTREGVGAVHYVGLPHHPGYEISRRQATGFGGMISFEVDSEARALRILERVRVLQYAESLGGVESLITYPMLQTHADMPRHLLEAKGINGRLLRLSVGLEAERDLIGDLDQAFGEEPI